jgi:hypothetical protein
VPDDEQLIGVHHIADPVKGAQIHPQAGVEPERLIDRQALTDHGED